MVDARAMALGAISEPGKQVTWGELNVGDRQVFEDAGFGQVSRPNVAS